MISPSAIPAISILWCRKISSALVSLEFCNQLFTLEEDYKKRELSFDQKFQARLERSKPVAEAFFAWVGRGYKKNPVSKSYAWHSVDLRRAAGKLTDERFSGWAAGAVQQSGRVLRAVLSLPWGGRTDCFLTCLGGADANDAIYSMVETAKANGLKPFEYLKSLPESLPAGSSPQDCLPWMPLAQILRNA